LLKHEADIFVKRSVYISISVRAAKRGDLCVRAIGCWCIKEDGERERRRERGGEVS
jgi:hypothetical protein